jgi:hypothetical protein
VILKYGIKPHAKIGLYFQNLGKRLSIDQTTFSNGELYTILTNKAVTGKKGAIVRWLQALKWIQSLSLCNNAHTKKSTCQSP